MIDITLYDSNFPHQIFLTPFLNSKKINWKRDGHRRSINVYTDNFIKKSVIDIPNDGNINICILLEPLTNPPWTDIYEYIQTDFEKFHMVITHNLDQLNDLIIERPDKFYYSTKCITTTWLDENMIKIHDKSKMVSMPLSFKNFSEGHRIRHIIFDYYKGSNKIDFYGSGIPNYDEEFRECFFDYKYVIICENTLQNGFNSEKLNDALLTGTIPIYWGSRINDNNYDANSIYYFSPKTNIINFQFQESLLNLERILDFIYNEDPYDSLLDSINKNFIYSNSLKQSEDNIYDILIKKGFLSV